jgi:hypothetical protein
MRATHQGGYWGFGASASIEPPLDLYAKTKSDSQLVFEANYFIRLTNLLSRVVSLLLKRLGI